MKLLRLAQGAYQVLAVCSDRGECALLSFLNELQGKLQAQADRMIHLLERVAREGPPRNTDVCHRIQGDIWQLRSGRVRVLWFYGSGPGVIVCSHGFLKAGQKTPKTEINQALQVWRRYHHDVAQGKVEILRNDDEE